MAIEDDGDLDRIAWAEACGAVLQRLMADVRTTGYHVSQMTGLSYSTVCRYARGERPPTLHAAGVICKFLGVTVDHFLTRARIRYEEGPE